MIQQRNFSRWRHGSSDDSRFAGKFRRGDEHLVGWFRKKQDESRVGRPTTQLLQLSGGSRAMRKMFCNKFSHGDRMSCECLFHNMTPWAIKVSWIIHAFDYCFCFNGIIFEFNFYADFIAHEMPMVCRLRLWIKRLITVCFYLVASTAPKRSTENRNLITRVELSLWLDSKDFVELDREQSWCCQRASNMTAPCPWNTFFSSPRPRHWWICFVDEELNWHLRQLRNFSWRHRAWTSCRGDSSCKNSPGGSAMITASCGQLGESSSGHSTSEWWA